MRPRSFTGAVQRSRQGGQRGAAIRHTKVHERNVQQVYLPHINKKNIASFSRNTLFNGISSQKKQRR